jgi:peroxiredoxin
VAPTHDPHVLPPDLPQPVDDGASAHLEGAPVPSLRLESTSGDEVDLASAAAETLVLYCYPRTGRPGEDPLPGWDAIPGARGCTPQTCAFRDHHSELEALGAVVFGLSSQSMADQQEVVERLGLPYPLLSDSRFALAEELALPTFEVGRALFYRRLTMIARAGKVAKVFYPVFPPDENAADVVAWLSAERAGN